MDKGLISIVMELGDTDLSKLLQKRLKKGEPLRMNFVRDHWEQILLAVRSVHNSKIIHTDLKPANFLIIDGEVKLIDFGIAKMIRGDTTNIQRDHQVGTLSYMSPEAILTPPTLTKHKLSRASDVWSLGCILYQIVYNKTPFSDLSVVQKIRCIPDPNYEIQYPRIFPKLPLTTPPSSPSKPVTSVSVKLRIPIASSSSSVDSSSPTMSNSSHSSSNATSPTETTYKSQEWKISIDHTRCMDENLVIDVIKRCLHRESKRRSTIDELLIHPFLHPEVFVEAGYRDDVDVVWE
ncbi:kinase-like domain-containing protein [Paraphysoderma sedebokerense]|nr:kinase-like domain-containing protein [Paraphysoderma sedebokerense]